MNRPGALLIACFVLAPSAAFADKYYHLANPGMCNKTDKVVTVSYKSDSGAKDFKPNGITKHRGGDKLAPGKCATLSFKVSGSPAGKIVDTKSATAGITFYVNDGYLNMTFDGDRHVINKDKQHHPTGYDIHASSGHHEHFHIEIKRRVKPGGGRDDKGDPPKPGPDGPGDAGGDGGEGDLKKAPTGKK